MVISSPVEVVNTATVFDCQIALLDYKSIICPGFQAVMHIHVTVEEITIADIMCLVDRKTGEKSKTKPRFVKSGQAFIARLSSPRPICLEKFREFPQFGRFTLRDEGTSCRISASLRSR
jgi:peptide chain release factor subunit 3